MNADLNALTAFVKVAHYRSFRQAALELKVSPSALSHSLSKLEQSLGVRLLHRSTRSVSLSEAGEAFMRNLAPALKNIESALEELNHVRITPMGKLRLNVPRAAAHLVLSPKLAAWRTSYPNIELDIVTNDALIDIVKAGFDAGIRFGESLQQDVIAVPIGPPIQFSACASPAYLAAHGIPQHPENLLQHQCLQYRFSSGLHYAWEFQSGTQKFEVKTTGAIASDDFFSLIRAAVDGAGICYTYHGYVREQIARGELQLILQDWAMSSERMYLYYSGRSQLPLSLRAFIDFYK